MGVNESAKYQLAKTFTELAIQNDLIDKRATATATAEEVTNFFTQEIPCTQFSFVHIVNNVLWLNILLFLLLLTSLILGK